MRDGRVSGAYQLQKGSTYLSSDVGKDLPEQCLLRTTRPKDLLLVEVLLLFDVHVLNHRVKPNSSLTHWSARLSCSLEEKLRVSQLSSEIIAYWCLLHQERDLLGGLRKSCDLCDLDGELEALLRVQVEGLLREEYATEVSQHVTRYLSRHQAE